MKLARTSGKVFANMGAYMRCVIPSNCLKIPASPLLQEYGQERAHEAKHEAEEPGRVDKYS